MTARDVQAGSASVIDVLENALGELTAERIARLTPSELDGLSEVVNQFYDAWEPPALSGDELRLYSGGCSATL